MQAFSGKKMGPPGPRALMVCPGPFRVVICSRSPSWFAATRENPAHTSVSTRDTGPTIAEQFWASTPSAKGFSGGFRGRLRALAGLLGSGVLEHITEQREHLRGGP